MRTTGRGLRARRGRYAGLLGLAALAGSVAPSHGEPMPPAITVQGEARAEVVPDIAAVVLGVDVERPTATGAAAEMARRAGGLVNAAKAAGIDPKDIASTALALTPVYDDTKDGRPGPLRAFHAATSVRIAIRPAEQAGAITARLLDGGANTIESIDYASSQSDSRLDELRAEAARDALRKAQIYAGALGFHLGPVQEVSPQVEAQPPFATMRMAMPAPAPAPAKAIPTAPGTISLRTDVTVRWSIAP